MRIVTALFLVGRFVRVFAGPRRRRRQGAARDRARVAQAAHRCFRAAPPRVRRVPVYRARPFDPDVYPRYNPGPNAVRECTATYVQEFRPSGTVITPRMSCYWRPG